MQSRTALLAGQINLRGILLFMYLVSFIWETLLESHGQSQCSVMEASYKMVEDLRISILSDSVVSQFLFILMARLVLKKLYFILLHVWPLRQLGLLMYLQKAQSYIHAYRISVINLRFLFSSPDLLCKVTCLPNVKTKSIRAAQV